MHLAHSLPAAQVSGNFVTEQQGLHRGQSRALGLSTWALLGKEVLTLLLLGPLPKATARILEEAGHLSPLCSLQSQQSP